VEPTRHKLLDAAIDAFAQDGFRGTSTRSICGAAGVNVATLNYHFGSKEGLYQQAMDEVYRRLLARLSDLIPRLGQLSRRQALGALVHAARQERQGVRLIVREVLDDGHFRESTQQRHLVPLQEQFVPMACAHLGVDPLRGHRAFITVSMLLGRFVIQSDASLAQQLHLAPGESLEGALADLIDSTLVALLEPAS
jgi:AcrR family transcriptional regulator